MRIRARVIANKIDEGQMFTKLQCEGRFPPVGKSVIIQFGGQRSGSQNNFYWLFLTFLYEDCSLKDEYASVEELHDTFKATFLSKRIVSPEGKEMIKTGSTTKLDKLAFGEYIEKINRAMAEFYQIDTSEFWREYEAQKNFARPEGAGQNDETCPF